MYPARYIFIKNKEMASILMADIGYDSNQQLVNEIQCLAMLFWQKVLVVSIQVVKSQGFVVGLRTKRQWRATELLQFCENCLCLS